MFVGLSFISLFEIAEIIMEIILCLSGKQKVRKLNPKIYPDIEKFIKLESELKNQNEKFESFMCQTAP